MIPILLLLGLASGRWWMAAAAAVAWPVVLVQADVMGVEPALLGGAALGALNAAIGVMTHRGIAAAGRAIVRLVACRHQGAQQEPAP